LGRSAGAGAAKPRSSALQGAVVTLLLLGLAGGAFAYRDRIPGLSGLLGTSAEAPPAPGRDGTAPSASDSIRASIASSSEVPPAAPPPAQADAVAATRPPETASPAPAAEPPPPPPLAEAAPATAAAQDAVPAGDAAAAGRLPGAGAAPAAQATAAPQVARATTPERPAAPPKPHVPTVAVVAAGDDVIASPAGDALIARLQSRGFRVIEGGHAQGDRPNLRALAGRADAVLFVNARPVGSQELTYYGQSSTLYTVQLGLRAYRLGDGSVLWTGGTQQVSFTSLNAAEKAREAIEPMLGDVAGRLDEFRPGGKRG